jgi:Domain of unknown function (DUF222)
MLSGMTSHFDPVAAVAALDACEVGSSDLGETVQLTQQARRVRAWLDAFDARVTARVDELHHAGSGVGSEELLNRNAGCSAAEARRRRRRAAALAKANEFAAALANGQVGAEHADALANATARADDAVQAEFFANEASLLDEASRSTPEDFAKHCRHLIDRLERDQGKARAQRQRDATALRRTVDRVTGMYRLSAEFDPELGTRLWTALDAEIAARLTNGSNHHEVTDRNRIAAHALVDLATSSTQAARPTAVEMVVLVDLDTLRDGLHDHGVCETHEGVELSVDTVRRLACDADIIPAVLNGDGVLLDLGRSRRLATREQRRAMRAMYDTCAFHGCDTSFTRCEIHHLTDWTHGGRTDLSAMVPLCAHHHHVVHDDGWHLELADDRTLTIRQPDGQVHAVCHPTSRPHPGRHRLPPPHERGDPGRPHHHDTGTTLTA